MINPLSNCERDRKHDHRLREDRSQLAIDLAVRKHGRDVAPHEEALRTAYPDASGDVVVLLHGLGENDDSWNLRRDELGGTYASRLADRTSWTPVLLVAVEVAVGVAVAALKRCR